MISTTYVGPTCPLCDAALDPARLTSGPQSCAQCAGRFEATRFDPPARLPHLARMAEAGPQGATPCGTHAGNAAGASCGRCGVFMCALCRVDIDARVLCAPCFDRLLDEDALPSARRVFKNHLHSTALLILFGLIPLIAAGPLEQVPLGVIAALMAAGALYYAILDLRQKRADAGGRLTPSGDGELVATAFALFFSTLELVGAMAVLVVLLRH